MKQLLDIRFSFLCRNNRKNAEGKSPIVFRITFRGQRSDIFTGLYCDHLDWNSKEGILNKSKEAALINPNIESIRRKAVNIFDEMRYSGEQFSMEELVEKIKGKEKKPELLIDYLEEANINMLKRVGAEITKATYYKYRKSLEYIQEFLRLRYKAKNYLLLRIDVGFLNNYFQFLRTEKNISNNTAIKSLSFLKVMLSQPIRTGLIKDDPFRQLKLKTKPVYPEFLTHDEIQKLEEVELENKDLDRKRDIFLFGCFTGLAYIDIKQLQSSHLVKESDGTYYILKPRQKTGQQSIIPLLPPAIRILLKYSPSGNITDFKWFISTNQKMNLGLKYIAQKANINKRLTMHVSRHTFSTTVTLANGVPIETVSKMLGHANIRQTQHYAKVVATKIKADMDKIKDLFR